MIDRAYEESQQAERLRAAEELAAMTVDDDVLEPDELSRYLNYRSPTSDLQQACSTFTSTRAYSRYDINWS